MFGSLFGLATISLAFFICGVEARLGQCSSDQTPCGPGNLCCSSDEFCNFNRGIPACENQANNYISGFNGAPCPDPYTYSCATFTGLDICCPIGTVCYMDDKIKQGACINAYGVTGTPLPSATSESFAPVETPVSNTAGDGVVFSPANAWTSTPSNESCSKSQTLYTTNHVGATATFNYTGPSIMIHTIFAAAGGVFNITVDGWPTGSTINTTTRHDVSIPSCYPTQFPPFHSPPPNYASQNNHTVILTYIGAQSPNVTVTGGTFDAFAIPFFNSSQQLVTSAGERVYSTFTTTTAVLTAFLFVLLGL